MLEKVSYLIGSAEERLARVHLHQDAAEGPHVDGQVVRHAQQHLRRAVEATLDVLVNLTGTNTVVQLSL